MLPSPGPADDRHASDPNLVASPQEWDSFLDAHPRATLYHTWRWTELLHEIFGFTVHRLAVRDQSGRLAGLLPLVEQHGPIFGRRLVSLPFFNYGGPLGLSEDVEQQLLAQAADLARRRRVATLEIRDRTPRHDLSMRTDKWTIELALPQDADMLGRQLGAKLRSQIRRADREEPVVACGGAELVAEFYDVFAATMRDLGTPVQSRRFFETLIERLASDCTVVVVRLRGSAAAAAWLTHFRDRTEIPWAASLRERRTSGVNMRLYWECLLQAMQRGSRVFDFGRSTVDSGTYRFKLQWGGEARPLFWAYPLTPVGSAVDSHGRLARVAQSLWSRLPLPVANTLGPMISPGLPW
jgi:FemAB-related protein (PEP-CTERM system-associated)